MGLPRVFAFLAAFSLACPAVSQAGLSFPTATGVSQTQLSLVITNLSNGDLLYTTTDRVTNNNTFAVNGIYEVVVGRNINGGAAQWDNTNQRWVAGSLTTKALNASFFLSMDRNVTDLAILPGFGVTTASSLAAFAVGSLAAGASATVVRQFEASPGVTSINSNIGLVSTAVPEPASAIMFVLGLSTAVTISRHRSRLKLA